MEASGGPVGAAAGTGTLAGEIGYQRRRRRGAARGFGRWALRGRPGRCVRGAAQPARVWAGTVAPIWLCLFFFITFSLSFFSVFSYLFIFQVIFCFYFTEF
jgi:hypothetical protein